MINGYQGAFIVTEDDVACLQDEFARADAHRRQSGYPATSASRDLRKALNVAAKWPQIDTADQEMGSYGGGIRRCLTEEASTILGESQRSITRKALSLGGIKNGKYWTFNRRYLKEIAARKEDPYGPNQ